MPPSRKLSNLLHRKAPHTDKSEVNADILVLEQHFDVDYYLKCNPDVTEAGVDALRHFCEFGWKEMRDPHPAFSVRYYLTTNADVREQGINPFVHYVTIGREEGREGKLFFDLERLSEDAGRRLDAEKDAVKHVFDPEFYLQQNPDIAENGIDPLDHYMRYGWREGRDPVASFSTRFYLKAYPDINAAGVNPFVHFVVAGEQEGRASLPVFHPDAQDAPSEKSKLDETIEAIRPYFNAEFYLENFPEAESAGRDPIEHFCAEGWLNGKDPSPEFSVSGYLELNPDVAESGVNPFWHYIVFGRDEGRPIMRAADYAERTQSPGKQTDIETIREHFDAAFYLFKYTDVARSGLDPLEHYWTDGWKEGRDPSAEFSTSFYLDTNPDVADLGVNPLWHYVVAGQSEGRLPKHPAGYRIDCLRNMTRLEQEVHFWARKDVPDKLLGSGELSDLILKARNDGSRELLLSVGHDHYHKVSGGVQFCEHREETISSTNGRVYLHLHPSKILPRLAHIADDDDPIVCLLINGEDLGGCRMSDLLRAVTTVRSEFDDAQIVIHQLLGHLPERISDLIKAAGRKECWLWLHDFLTVCPSFTLQRNNVSFCGAPPLGSNACELCRYGEERQAHAARFSAFFDEIYVHALSPSEVMAETWQQRSGLTPASMTVVPHMTLEWRKRATPPPMTPDRITVGFLGTPAPHKGWNVFENLFRRFGRGGPYRFVFLGASGLPANGIDYHSVHVTAENPDAMIDAVRQEKIDLVVHWASWPETFSLSTHEAYAGGAYVLTNGISGNVAATVERLQRGAVLSDENDLTAFFEDDRAKSMVQTLREERRKYEVHHQLSRMVHDAIDIAATKDRP